MEDPQSIPAVAGEEVISKAVEETSGLKSWDKDSVIAFLLGKSRTTVPDAWTLEQLCLGVLIIDDVRKQSREKSEACILPLTS